MENFGENVRALRINKGLTATGLAEKVGISHVAIGNIEKGAKPKFEVIKRIAEALSVSVSQLTDGTMGSVPKISAPIATITTPKGKRVSIYENEEGISININ